MKKVLGIVPSAKSITLAVIEGDNSSQKHVPIEKEIYTFAPVDDQTKLLSNLSNFIKTLINEKEITEVEILKAGTSPQGQGASATRVKAEAAIQLAASNANIPANLIAPQSLTAAKKKADKTSQPSTDDQVGHTFSSNDKRNAATLALLRIKKSQ